MCRSCVNFYARVAEHEKTFSDHSSGFFVKRGVESFNFGIKSSTLKTFANSNGLNFIKPNNRDLSNKDLGQLITSATIYLECHMTVAKVKIMIAEANSRKAFFSEYK